MPKVSQQTIADALGISKATVSRCFTNHQGISPETRSRVFQKASELGYKPIIPRGRKSAEQAAMTRVAVVACVPTGRFGNDVYDDPGSEILEGLNEIALVNDWALETHFIDPLAEEVGAALFRLVDSTRGAPWDGLLLVYPFPRDSLTHLVNRLPCVSVMEEYGSHLPLDCVDVDSHRSISMMVDKLAAAGHRRIGFYSETYPVDPSFVLRRFSAFSERMAYHNLRPDNGDILGVYPDTRGESRRYLDEVKTRVDDGMTALVCAADHQAYPIIQHLQDNGLRIPRDLSITGFDAIPVPEGLPRLHSVRVPYKEVGIAAMQRLANVLQLRSFATRHILIECSEAGGETIAAPRG